MDTLKLSGEDIIWSLIRQKTVGFETKEKYSEASI